MRARGTDSARVIQVIETKSIRGEGIEKDPVRTVIQYWDLKGNLLAEADNVKMQEENTFNFVQTTSMERIINAIKEQGEIEK